MAGPHPRPIYSYLEGRDWTASPSNSGAQPGGWHMGKLLCLPLKHLGPVPSSMWVDPPATEFWELCSNQLCRWDVMWLGKSRWLRIEGYFENWIFLCFFFCVCVWFSKHYVISLRESTCKIQENSWYPFIFLGSKAPELFLWHTNYVLNCSVCGQST